MTDTQPPGLTSHLLLTACGVCVTSAFPQSWEMPFTIRETLNSSGVAALPPILQCSLWHSASSQGPERFFWVGSAQPRQGTGQHLPILGSINAFLAASPAEGTTSRKHCLRANNDHQQEAKMGKPRYSTARRKSLSSQSCSRDRDQRSEALTTITHGQTMHICPRYRTSSAQTGRLGVGGPPAAVSTLAWQSSLSSPPSWAMGVTVPSKLVPLPVSPTVDPPSSRVVPPTDREIPLGPLTSLQPFNRPVIPGSVGSSPFRDVTVTILDPSWPLLAPHSRHRARDTCPLSGLDDLTLLSGAWEKQSNQGHGGCDSRNSSSKFLPGLHRGLLPQVGKHTQGWWW